MNLIDLVVVGAGPCGLAVGAAARTSGLDAVLLDRGCVTNSLIDYPHYMTFFSTAEKLEIDEVPFIVPGGKPTRRDALVYYRRVAQHFELDVRQFEDVLSVEGREGDFTVRTRRKDGTESAYRARAVVIATGGFHEPNFLGVPGEDLDKVHHYYVEPEPYFDQDVMVVGGGNSAVESALELFRAHARVTLVHFLNEFDRGVKPWIVPDITNRVGKGEIPVRWRTRVAEIRPQTVVLRNEVTGNLEEITNDWVFAMTGWRADPHTSREPGCRDRLRDRNPVPRPRDDGDERRRRLHRGRAGGGQQRQQDLHREREAPRPPDRGAPIGLGGDSRRLVSG